MKRSIFVILSFLLSSAAEAASFDCEKAVTKIEKLICSSAELSLLDEELGSSYRSVLEIYTVEDKTRAVAEQRQWLKQTRNICADKTCLINVYNARISELKSIDPFFDKDISCEEMRKFPAYIFQGRIDLGSGHGSPVGVDYACDESLAVLPFMTELLSLAETIRSDYGPQICTGSIIHAQWRYYHFALAKAGFLPADINHVDISNVEKYFEQWSWESPYNNRLYKTFYSEFDTAHALLTDHYQRQFQLAKVDSETQANNALMMIINRAAGGFPQSVLKKPSRLVELSLENKSSVADLQAELASLPEGLISKNQVYYALKVALYNNKTESFIRQMLLYIGENQKPALANRDLHRGDESALFAALQNKQFVDLLLDNGEPIDYINSFGKSALYYSIQLNDHELAASLLRRGANVNHTYKTRLELNPADWTCAADTYIKHTRRTPLMHAAQHADKEMIELLVAAGARLDAIDEIGSSVVDYAVMGKKPENEAYLKSISVKTTALN